MKHSTLVRLSAYGLRTGLFLIAVTVCAGLVFGSPSTLKSALQASGAYQKASVALVEQAGNALRTLDNQPAVDTAAQASFTPAAVQTATESAVDSSYDWLEGTTDSPNISIDFRPYINGFTQNLGEQATQRASALPICTAAQLQQIDPGNIDVFDLPCQPPGINLASAKDQAIARATTTNSFLQNPVLSTESLPKDAEGRTVIDRADSAPTIYAWVMRAPWIVGGLTLLCAISLGFLMRADWRHAIRKLGRSLVGVGITLLVIVGLARLFFWYATQPDSFISRMAADEYHTVIIAFIRSLEQAYTDKLLLFGVVYAAIGIAVIAVMRLLKKPSPPVPESS